MKKMKKSVEIRTDRETVWSAIISDRKYRTWTEAFHAGSHFKGGWQVGDKIRFLAEEPDGCSMGMIAEIVVSECPGMLSIRHIGMIVDGKEIYEGEELAKFSPAYENYWLEPLGVSGTLFRVEADVEDEYYSLFDQQWDEALVKLKEVCEQGLERYEKIAVETVVSAPIGKAWDYWTAPEHVMQWNAASSGWFCPKAENHARTGGRFVYTMSARDGSASFDFSGTHTEVETHVRIDSMLDDGRRMTVTFTTLEPGSTRVVEEFEAEGENTLELQRAGWQAILDHYREVVEGAM